MPAETFYDRRADFLPEAWGILAGMEEALHGIASAQRNAAEHLLLVLAHRMAGSAAMFGMDEVARTADAMEAAAHRLSGNGESSESDRRQALETLAGSLPVLSSLLESEQVAPADPLTAELQAFVRREPDTLEYFLPELREHLDEAGEVLARAAEAQAPADGGSAADDVATVFRRLHTVKGAAFVVGCKPVGELAHRIEDALAAYREAPGTFDASAARSALAGVDVLHRMAEVLAGRPPARSLTQAREAAVAQLAGPPAGGPAVQETVRETVQETVREAVHETPPAPLPEPAQEGPASASSLRVQLKAVDDLVHLAGELLVARNRLEREIEHAEALRLEAVTSIHRLREEVRSFSQRHVDPNLQLHQLQQTATPAGLPGGAAARSEDGTPPMALSDLELDRYDDFNILARRLEEIAADMAEVELEEGGLFRELRASSEGLESLVERLQSKVGGLRLVPIGQLFSRAVRLARRTAAALGKQVSPELAGERVEVDAAIAEQVWTPLIHLVQNALAHGIEAPARRLALGKPAAGRLSLRAFAEGRRVIVEVEDDGAGIDTVRVRERARQMGARPQEPLATLSTFGEREALRLVFAPGLSTAGAATGSSGRGVGLDVVRTTLERLGGSVEVSSVPGGGTRFRLAFPLTLVVTETLLVRVGGDKLAIHATAVERIVETDTPEGGPAMAWMDGEAVPVVDLAPVLSIPVRRGKAAPAVIVGTPGNWRGLLVDEVLGSENAVLRPLGPFLAGLDLYSGALLTRQGELVLLLNSAAALSAAVPAEGIDDPAGAWIDDPAAAAPGAGAALPARPEAAAVQPLRILLADDSLSVRRVLGSTLKRSGFDVSLAADGEEALELLSAQPFDLVLTDIEMPRRNGFELITWVRRQPALAGLPVVVVTTRVGDKHQELARQCGATAFLSKPIEEELLLRTVAGLATRRER